MWSFKNFLLIGTGIFVGALASLRAHQIETPADQINDAQLSSFFTQLESGQIDSPNLPKSIVYLGKSEYELAFEALTKESGQEETWFKDYLAGMISVSSGTVKNESLHFILLTPPDQAFLSRYALPTLERMGEHLEKILHHRPKGKITVEIYPDKVSFSKASTLSDETLERSGAIGICKFHRLMILSPQALPLGYRWLDTLAHEYTHLIINEISQARMELWLHEGIARYFDTSYRAQPPLFLTPAGKTQLMEAVEKKELIPFSRMSPSMVYLKNQEEVSLAFAEVAHAISVLVAEKGGEKLFSFLKFSATEGSRKAFQLAYGISPDEFENYWKEKLAQEKWDKTKGAMTDDIRFRQADETAFIGASVQGQVRLGDKMRQKGLWEGALIQYRRALEEEPDNAVILLKAAWTYLALNNLPEAVLSLKKAVEKNPNYGTPYIELAKYVSPKEAISLLLEANAINPFNPQIHKDLADNYAKTGELEKSEEEKVIGVQLTGER